MFFFGFVRLPNRIPPPPFLPHGRSQIEFEDDGGIVVLLGVSTPAGLDVGAGGEPITVTPVLFSQGVNALQSMSSIGDLHPMLSFFGTSDMQHNINAESFGRVVGYVRDYTEYRERVKGGAGGGSGGGSGGGGGEDSLWWASLNEIQATLNAVRHNLERREETKNMRLLAAAARLTRLVEGGRITCCKSGKDRTAMSVTLEQARLLDAHHFLHEHVVQTANLMRSHGVRRENVIVNIENPSYAFNMVTLALLPEEYTPPAGTGRGGM